MSTLVNSSPAMEQVPTENEMPHIKLLTAIDDDYGGVMVELSEPMDSLFFSSTLRASITRWRNQGKRGVWIKVPIELVSLVEAVVKQGFWYHHAEPQYLMLVYWLPEGYHTLPENASHQVRIGAFVMNEKREVLVVQEKLGIFRGTGLWKFPTGIADQGEDICAAAVREVKEETAIDTEFVEVLAFRQSHKSFYEKSDLFFVCMLQPLSFDIQKQESEIEAAQWMPLEEFQAEPYVRKNECTKHILDVCLAKKDNNYSGFSPVSTTSGLLDENNYLYFNCRDLKRK